ncbi:fimbrial protein [Prevotella sp. 10(H)]|uniref:fimbrial tip adhesin FimD n=1 Tax=Prevotella sp. 10(H) TaxID=1158294 RepID=UPI0004A6F284|nr:fimbrial protein [Prevotella sp. 10(H)]
MKRLNTYIIIILSVLAGTFISCSQDDDTNETNSIQKGNIIVKLSVNKANGTKAVSETGEDALNENRIKTLDVFIYKVTEDACAFYQRITPPTELTGASTFDAVLDATQERFNRNDQYYTYVIANYGISVPEEGMPLSQLKKLVTIGINPDAVQNYFFMDGVSEGIVLNDGIIVNKEIPVPMKRVAAKLRIGMTYANGLTLSATTPVSKRLMNFGDISNLVDNTDHVVAPVQLSMSSFTTINAGVSTNNKIVLYSYANDWNNDPSKETYVIVNVPVTDSQGVEHPQNYYRVPVNYVLSNGNTVDPDSYRIHRNYLYDITLVVNKLGSTNPFTAQTLNGNYIIQDWTTKEVIVEVEGINFLYVKDTNIKLPNSTTFTTTFQSSSQDVQISDITVNDEPITNGTNGVNITWDQQVKSGNIVINSTLPVNFVEKTIKFTVSNGSGISELSQEVTVAQYPSFYLSSDISADAPDGTQGQNNNKMYIMTSLVADFSTLQDPDEFDEPFDPGYYHYAPDPALGASYAEFIRTSAVLGYPLVDANGATIDTPDNNRRLSPRFMLASQHGATAASNYTTAKTKCADYQENDKTTGELYTDWRIPTIAEIYMIDILQNTRVSEVKKILEGGYYWSARQSPAVKYMDPRVGAGNNVSNPYNAAVRCVRDVKENR